LNQNLINMIKFINKTNDLVKSMKCFEKYIELIDIKTQKILKKLKKDNY
jgi:hypothetical protein